MVNNTVRGLFCLRSRVDVGLCNPSTKQHHIFPQLKFKDIPEFFYPPKYFFGYDPVEDQYKVLAIDNIYGRGNHKVMVVGREGAWREAPCLTCLHRACTTGLYMNGSIYYGAVRDRPDINSPINSIIVSFNVRFETYNIFEVPMDYGLYFWTDKYEFPADKTLINYRGKIGVVENSREGSFRMWVVEDTEKEEWSMNTYHLPLPAAGLDFKVMEIFHTGEICLVSKELFDPFSLFYYNLKTKSMRSVTIEGLPISELERAVAVSDHYENFMSLET